MPVALSINHPRAAVLVNRRRLRRLTEQLLRECDAGGYTVSLHLVADAEIQELNRRYRHKDQPTNVLSFPFADGIDPALAELPVAELGDIVISLDTAGREAREFGQSFDHRLLWLVTHGLLHLLGYDHERSPAEEQRMQAREEELLARLTTHRRTPMPSLAINVDHVATIRQARGTIEPDPVAAAAICELAGASGIVVHLREDRRHIQDRDVLLLRQTVKTRLNLEMGANREIINFALDLRPDLVTLVPEKRQELTTEGGLNVIAQKRKLAQTIKSMASRDIPVSIFIDPDPAQIQAANDIGATYVEIHTGRYCDAATELARDQEFQLVAAAVEEACRIGLRVNAGHGLDYRNTAPIAALEGIDELSIGHAIISRSVYTGLNHAVREMLTIIREARY
ncbi:pyridoxine 5-phosphate synthase [Desulfoprunum benzoelyticum]|uniref:Multifunctional fusion protein n=1 Tax=Desulfoprunum benzoelyticum TaxID=1506996 RepID=A0A840UYI4_9BACT|nr:pyridoxine 5-phosphate synthase [Desulfoprunum benzoelyticum]